jgi:hypothetical protein
MKIDKDIALYLIKNQIKLLQNRDSNFENVTLNNIENISFIENFNKRM